MDEVRCTGNEAALWLCPFYGSDDDDDNDDYADDDDDDYRRRRRLRGAWGSHDCDHYEDAGVVCDASTYEPTILPAPTYSYIYTEAPTPVPTTETGATTGSGYVMTDSTIRTAVALWFLGDGLRR